MTRTHLLLGPPGTGKTTRLLDEVDAALKNGTPPERIGFFAFTRKAANEAISRATKKFNIDDNDLPWFRTLHSAAYKMLGLSPHQVMNKEHLEELSEALGCYTFEHQYDETMERPPKKGGLGDRCMSVSALSRATMQTVESQWNSIVYPDVTKCNVTRFHAALEEYKYANQVLDFADFLDESTEALELDLMILDEAQDLTAQQWEFARRIGRFARKVVIAGDDDQAIFQWAGADLRRFLSFKGKVEVLPRSYRLPQQVWKLCNQIVRRIHGARHLKEWQPRDKDDSSVIHIPHPDRLDLNDDKTWLLLVRNTIQIEALEQLCRAQGVVYHGPQGWSNRTKGVQAVLFYERLRRGETITAREMKQIATFIPRLDEYAAYAAHVKWGDIGWPFEGTPDWMTALSALGGEEREYIRKLRSQNESLVNPGRVIISTIHGAKGGEADNVLLVPDMTKRTHNEMYYNHDQETRVWYVGASRAKEKLFITQPKSRRFYRI